MPFLNKIFSKSKTQKTVLLEKETEAKEVLLETAAPVLPKTRENRRGDFLILMGQHLTEKGSGLGVLRKYVFRVSPRANKVEIARAVRGLYNVKVKDVNIINLPRKARRIGRSTGFKSGFKKAVVTLKEGEVLELSK